MKYDLPEEGVYVGEIIAYTDCGFYEIRYTNGDGEELSEEDVTMYVEEERQAENEVKANSLSAQELAIRTDDKQKYPLGTKVKKVGILFHSQLMLLANALSNLLFAFHRVVLPGT